MPILNASRWYAVSLEPTEMYTTIKILHVESGLIWKDDIVLFLYPALLFGTPNSPFFLCCFVKGSQRDCRWTDRPCCCKHWRTIWAESECATNIPISWLMVCDVVIWFCRADLTICLSTQALVMVGHWDPACCSVRPSATHSFHICMTVDGCEPEQRAIMQNNSPHLSRK